MYKILIVEDEELILQGIKNIVDWESLGLEIIGMVQNGMEALQIFKNEEVDIILTDINMPKMSGLELLKIIRETNKRVRFVIISGYDEFEYARLAIPLSVENYILKPIDEEQLYKVLLESVEKLKALDSSDSINGDEETCFMHYLSGMLDMQDTKGYIEKTKFKSENSWVAIANIKLNIKTMKGVLISHLKTYLQNAVKNEECHIVFNTPDEILILIYRDSNEMEFVKSYFSSLQSKMESHFNILTFTSISNAYNDFSQLPEAYIITKKLQKYLITEGYGSCIDSSILKNRKYRDIVIDKAEFHRMILKKDKGSAIRYLDDLFINNIESENIQVDIIYKLSIKVVMILEEIAEEFQLSKREDLKNIADIIGALYYADNMSDIKGVLIGEVMEIIDLLNVGDSQYTPVVKQIIQEVKNNYRQDMNLKTLAYKYNINTSYLGQIFQKETGISFSQYYHYIRNSRAREMILNTNMKINDIAKEVGYLDTSYFYRKFKQIFGISPVSLRELKKY